VRGEGGEEEREGKRERAKGGKRDCGKEGDSERV